MLFHTRLDIISHSKTTCFTIEKTISYTLGKHLHDSKTICFTFDEI